MDLEAINKVASFEQKECKKLTDLTKDIVRGRFGRVVLLELEEVVIYSPNRMIEAIDGKESKFIPIFSHFQRKLKCGESPNSIVGDSRIEGLD